MRCSALLLALVLSGCVPVVQHGPWVRPGSSGSVGGSAGIAGDFGGEAEFAPFISFEGGIRAGLPYNDSTRQGVGLGVQLPLFALLVDDANSDTFDFLEYINLDGYFSGPMWGGRHTALGVIASRFHYMPYVQVGEYDDWFATVAVSVPTEANGVMIAPSYTKLRRNTETWVTQATYTAALRTGHGETIFMAGISLIFEFHRKNARTGS